MENIPTNHPRYQSLGKKQANILASIFGGTRIIGPEGGEILHRDTAHQQISELQYMDTFEHSGKTNIRRPKVLGSIIGPTATKYGYIHGIDRDSVGLVASTVSAATSAEDTPITMRLVFGGTEQSSIRSLSYPLPAMQMLERMTALDVDVNLQVVFANKVSAKLNRLNRAAVYDETCKTIFGITRLAQTMSLSDRIGFYTDQDIDLGLVYDAAKRLDSTAINKFLPMGLDTEDRGIAARYAAAHFVLHDGPATQMNFIGGVDRKTDDRIMVDIGSLQERHFRFARTLLAEEYNSPLVIPQVYTKHRVPPYYMARGGDIALDSAFGTDQIANLPPEARYDIEYLGRHVDLNELMEGSYV